MPVEPGTQINDSHRQAVQALILGTEGEWESHYSAIAEKDNGAQAYSTLLAFSVGIAVRRRFSGHWSLAHVIRYVADLRIALDQDANKLNPRLAEALIRFLLGDNSVKESLTASEDQENLVQVETLLLLALVAEANLDETGVNELLDEAASNAERQVKEDVGYTGERPAARRAETSGSSSAFS
ncbi:Uncharacterised protein [Mycobacterium tuberculosis]|nr:Uncharacterised protein [Mycobacterium tuberculosis]